MVTITFPSSPIVHETDKAILVHVVEDITEVDAYSVWFPKSQLKITEGGTRIEFSAWILAQKNINVENILC